MPRLGMVGLDIDTLSVALLKLSTIPDPCPQLESPSSPSQQLSFVGQSLNARNDLAHLWE